MFSAANTRLKLRRGPLQQQALWVLAGVGLVRCAPPPEHCLYAQSPQAPLMARLCVCVRACVRVFTCSTLCQILPSLASFPLSAFPLSLCSLPSLCLAFLAFFFSCFQCCPPTECDMAAVLDPARLVPTFFFLLDGKRSLLRKECSFSVTALQKGTKFIYSDINLAHCFWLCVRNGSFLSLAMFKMCWALKCLRKIVNRGLGREKGSHVLQW